MDLRKDIMRQCKRCQKSYKKSRKRNKLRGHYNPTPHKRKKANLVKTHLLEGKGTDLVCTDCLKTLTKEAKVTDN
ncbi:MAG: hypothetical protein ABEI53_00530 [Candidatus Magasanikbacteria bacterium]